MRVVVAEDSVLFREGLTRLLGEAGHEVTAAVGDADELVRAVRRACRRCRTSSSSTSGCRRR